VIVVMMENRSFDHYLGWVPGADGKQAGLSFVDSNGQTQATHDLSPNYQNCGLADPDHSYDGSRKQFNDGKMDGWLQTQPAGDTFPIGYYTDADLPFFKGVAANWTICDAYHCGLMGPTLPNRKYMHAGQTDKIDNSMDLCKLPTIWDAMKSVGASARYYFSDDPVTALWGTKYLDISEPVAAFLAASASGTLPNLSFVDPYQIGESSGVARDDHPLADIRDGQVFLTQIYEAVRLGLGWKKTLLIVNYDEHGGFFDHVPPPIAPVTPEEFAATGNDGRLGFRVPCAIIGPRARRGHVEHTPFDPNSILNFLAWRFGFPPLGARASSKNLALALDFDSPLNTDAPSFGTIDAGPFGSFCKLQDALPAGMSLNQLDTASRRQAEHLLEVQALQTLARRYGFPV
jgi:phospholipase C